MPIIIDANRGSDFNRPYSGLITEILVRISQRRIRVCVGGRLLKELADTPIRTLLVEWARAGCLHRISESAVTTQEQLLARLPLKSNDVHVVALARASNTRLLYTEDNALIADFKNSALMRPKGRIIKTRTSAKSALKLLNQLGE